MYIMESMIDLGLGTGQQWPEDPAYREIAKSICLCNPSINTRSKLMSIVGKILSIPKDRIRTVTFLELPEFGIELEAIR